MSEHVLDRLSAYLDDELSAEDRGLVDGHLVGCPACARRLEDLGVVDKAMRELPVRPPAGYFEAFPARVRQRLEGHPRVRTRRLPAWTWAAAAAALLAVIVPLTLMRSRLPAPEEPMARVAALPPASTPPASPTAAAPPANRIAPSAFSAPPAAELKAATAPGMQTAGTVGGAIGGRQDYEAAREVTRGPGASLAGGPAAAVPFGSPPPPAQVKAAGAFAPPPPVAAQPRGEAQAAPAETLAADRATADAAAPARPRSLSETAEAPAAAGPEATLQDQMARKKARSAQEPSPSAPSEADRMYRSLASRSTATLDEVRALREAWRSFSQLYPQGPPADEARVRVVAEGARAYQLGSDPADLARLREDARVYLERKDAAQAPRVRTILERFGITEP